MNKNIYGNFILTALLIVTVFAAYIIVKSMDGLSLRVEKAVSQSEKLQNELASIRQQMSNMKFNRDESPSAKTEAPANGKMANSEFYDENAVPADE